MTMDQSSFDAKGFIEFDLRSGKIRSAGSEQLTLVPTEVLAELEPGEPLKEAARDWGRVHGGRLKEHLSSKGKSGGMEALADHLGGTAAALGMGRLSVEIVGDALLFRSKSKADSSANEGLNALMSGFLAGYLDALTGRSFDVAPLGPNEGDLIFLAGNSNAVNRVFRWREEGVDLFAAIGRLSEGSI
jgi:hypothetical protein